MAVEARRRIRRIATERPATEAVVVRVIMVVLRDSLLARSIRGRSLRSNAARRPSLVRSAHRTARCREPERIDGFLTRGIRGSQCVLDRWMPRRVTSRIMPANPDSVNQPIRGVSIGGASESGSDGGSDGGSDVGTASCPLS